MYRKYCLSNKDELHDVYKSWSNDKEEAFKACLSDMKRNDGYDMRITAATTFEFSCAYRIAREDGIYLVYHTRCNRFEFQITEEAK